MYGLLFTLKYLLSYLKKKKKTKKKTCAVKLWNCVGKKGKTTTWDWDHRHMIFFSYLSKYSQLLITDSFKTFYFQVQCVISYLSLHVCALSPVNQDTRSIHEFRSFLFPVKWDTISIISISTLISLETMPLNLTVGSFYVVGIDFCFSSPFFSLNADAINFAPGRPVNGAASSCLSIK